MMQQTIIPLYTTLEEMISRETGEVSYITYGIKEGSIKLSLDKLKGFSNYEEILLKQKAEDFEVQYFGVLKMASETFLNQSKSRQELIERSSILKKFQERVKKLNDAEIYTKNKNIITALMKETTQNQEDILNTFYFFCQVFKQKSEGKYSNNKKN